MAVKSKNMINGSFGKVWVEGELWAECEGLEAKVTIEREDIYMAGKLGRDSKMIGYSVEGSIKIKKVYSRAQKIVADKIKRGEDVRVQIVTLLDDPDALGSQRCVFEDCWFNEIDLGSFNVKEIGSESIPFGAADYDIVETI